MFSDGEVKWEDTKAQKTECSIHSNSKAEEKQTTSGKSLAKTTDIDKGESP